MKLLSIDGGGVRGISSMVILLAIMEKVKELENMAGIVDDSERLPCRYFDLAGGTSTGGLAAIMLFRLEKSVPQVIERYQNMAAKIFSNKDRGPYTSDDGSAPVGSCLNWLKGLMTDGPLKEKLFNILYYICIFSGCSHYSGKGLIDAVDEVANVNRRKGERELLLDDSKPKTYVEENPASRSSRALKASRDVSGNTLIRPDCYSQLSMSMEAKVSCGPIRHPRRDPRLLKTASHQNFGA